MGHGKNEDLYHVTPLKTYFGIFGALLVLTVVTVLAARVDFGALNMVIAMLIASVKAGLVMLFFMHLKYENKMNRVIFALGFFFLLVLFGFSVIDIYTRVNPLN
jgi:cytochrome c oxidase subunit 4